jgi:nucleoid-associated protein YgaU
MALASAVLAAGGVQQLARATLEIVYPRERRATVPLRFNPAEYQWKKSQTFAEIGIPGLSTPPLQWVRGGAEVLTFDAVVDTSDTLENVDTKYVNNIRGLLTPAPNLHAPPIVDFVWAHTRFRGVLDGLTITYMLFDEAGLPLRAKLAISLKQYRPVDVTLRQERRSSPDVDKTWVVRDGDTLASIAADVYDDPSRWRDIARANDVGDPRDLRVGRRLKIPRLR